MGVYMPTAKNIATICGHRGMNCLAEAGEAAKEIYTVWWPSPTSSC